MKPVIALVGRPNVGKSTLFNHLTKTRDALVADQPGLTRDRKYGRGVVGDRPYIVVDTGGLTGGERGVEEIMARQAVQAIQESDAVLFVTDGRAGLTGGDEEIARQLRQTGRPVFLVVNKTEGMPWATASAEFHALGLGDPHTISAAHGDGIHGLMEEVLERFPQDAEDLEDEEAGIKVAIVGRPNVGKSTLVNRVIGEERVVVYDMPGTTRDSIYVPFERDGQAYTFIDTAGVRRRARVEDTVEKFSVIKTLQSIEEANVVIMVLDAREGVGEQDATLLGHVLDAGRALVIAINKWDNLSQDQRDQVRRDLDFKIPFVEWAKVHFISALHGTGVGELFASVRSAYKAAMARFATPELTRMLESAVAVHTPPLVRGRRIKMRYAHQGGRNPPIIIIHGSQPNAVPDSYKRFLVNFFREQLRLQGTPLRVEFRGSENPYEGKKNTLTPRQVAHRKRLVRHIKKRETKR